MTSPHAPALDTLAVELSADPRLAERIASLSPAKRQLLEMRLQQVRATVAQGQGVQAIPRHPVGEPTPLSFGQQRFWFIHELEPEMPYFNTPLTVRVRGPLDLQALEKTLATVIARHAIFRTSYRQDENGQPVQVVMQNWVFTMPVVDLRSDPNREERLIELLTAEVRRRFDLTRDLSIRATVYIMGDDDYALCEVHHHIATDFWSAGIVRRQMSELYESFREGRTLALPEPPIEYVDFAAWQRQQEQTEEFRRQAEYWRRKLAGPLPRLALPPVDGAGTSERRIARMLLPPELMDGLQELGRSVGATPFMALASAFLALFHRYSSQDDLIIGVLNAGRNRVELETVVGSFINTLVYRTDLSGDPSFRELLRRVRQVALEALSNQDVPFERVVADVHPERNPHGDPIVQVMLDFLNAPGSRFRLGGVEVTPIEIDKGTAEYDMLVAAKPVGGSENGGGLDLRVSFRTGVYSLDMVERMLGHLAILIEGAIALPEARISDLPLLSAAERHRLLVEWNDTARAFPSDVCFHELFEQQARRTPSAIAARDHGGTTSYRELNDCANRCAHALLAEGVQSGDVVALLAGRSTAFLAAMLGIWKAGAVYLPLDPRWPPARLEQVLGQSQARWLIIGGDLGPAGDRALASGRSQARRLGLETLLAPLAGQQDGLTPAPDPPSHARPGDLAYVIYTSGSTGVPKGAMVEHRGMLNHLYAKIHDLELAATDIVAQNSPQSFDISVWQFLAALLAGGQTCIFPDEVAFDPAALLGQVDDQGVTVFEATPSLLRPMLDVAGDAPGRGRAQGTYIAALARLRWLIPTGEALPPSLSRAWFARFPHVRQMNAYGPTECSDDVTHYRMERAPDALRPILPIGRPVPNMRLYILDSHLQPSPIGVAGEIYVGGVGVGRGYLHEPARTAAAFIPDPFSQQPGARLYRTGDLGRWVTDNGYKAAEAQIEFLGRVDFQIKLRGHRIELGEIENALLQHPAVAEAAALTTDASGEDSLRLVACLALRNGHSLTAADAAQHLRATLPPYMIPAGFVILEAPAALPKTTSGKIDRKALAALAAQPDYPAGAGRGGGVAPRTAIEARIAALWSDLLKQPVASVEDDFFDLGGHSLLAAQMVYRLRQEFNSDLPLRRLFETPSVAGLAAYIEGHGTENKEYEGEGARSASRSAQSPIPTTRSLLPLRPHGQKPPFFFLAGGGGSEDEYLNAYAGLIHCLGPDQPVYGFQGRGIADDLEPHRSVQEMAADFVAELRDVQMHGPYYLGGECIGGKLALEMARVLQEQGEEVALLVLLNCMVKGLAATASAPATGASHGWQHLDRRLKELRRLPAGQRLPRLGLMARNAAAVLLPVTDAQRHGRDRRAAKLRYTTLLKGHLIDPYPGDIVLMMTPELIERGHAEAWQEIVQGQLTMLPLQGAHRTYLGEFVDANSAALRACLQPAPTKARP